MKRKKRSKAHILYKHHQNFIRVAYAVLIIGSCLTVGVILAMLNQAHQLVMANTNKNLIELSQSVSTSLEERFEETWTILESVAQRCSKENIVTSDALEKLQEKAEILQFEYFALIAPDGLAICSDGISRTFNQQDEIMKAFQGQSVIEVTNQAAIMGEENKNMPVLAVPVYSNGGAGEISSILAAPVSQQWTNFFLTQSYYGGDVFFNIIKSDGTEVFMTQYSHAPQFDEQQDLGCQNNLFDTLDASIKEIIGDITINDMREAAAAGRNEIIRFRLSHDKLIQVAFLTHIGDTDLCVWMVDANDASSGGFDQLLHRASLANTIGAVCFIAVIITLIMLYRKNMRMLMVDRVTHGYSMFRFSQEAESLVYHSDPGEYTLIVMNIVHFKYLNDTYGHSESDRLLKHVHNMLLKYMESGEILTRSGADDFNLLVRTTSDEVIIQKLDLMVDEVNRFNDELTEKEWIMFSAGVYQIVDTSLSIIQIKDRANIAREKLTIETGDVMYSCGFYDEADRAQLQKEEILKNKMGDALKNLDFKVYFQPKVDISTGKIVAAEALVRWKDVDMGLVPPDEFIPLFERIGFIRKLDLYMFEQVCVCLRRWLDEGLQPVQISINLSRVHLANKDFLKPFVAIQKKYCIPPELLEFELLESALQEFPEALPEAVCQIHMAGYTCSLDDFGSGYSSLNNLESLDIDVVKLDREFLNTARTEGDRGCIVIEELIHMARRLGITVCCEGVETTEQLAVMQKLHCDKGQGYLFSKPIEVAAFEKLVYGTSL